MNATEITRYHAYNGNTEKWEDLRSLPDTQVIAWLDEASAANDTEVRAAAIEILNERDVPGWWSPGYDSDYDLYDADTAEVIRTATNAEYEASKTQAERDGGAGIITIDGRRCYVIGD